MNNTNKEISIRKFFSKTVVYPTLFVLVLISINGITGAWLLYQQRIAFEHAASLIIKEEFVTHLQQDNEKELDTEWISQQLHQESNIQGRRILIVLINYLILIVAGISIIWLSGRRFTKILSKPLEVLYNKVSNWEKGNFQALAPSSTAAKNELEKIDHKFCQVTQQLEEHIQELSSASEKNAYYHGQLESARSIRDSLLPYKNPLILPKISLTGSLDHHQFGDFFDFYPIDEDKIAIFIVKLPMHTIGGGLRLAQVSSLFEHAGHRGSPETIGNELICDIAKDQAMDELEVELCIAVVNLKTESLATGCWQKFPHSSPHFDTTSIVENKLISLDANGITQTPQGASIEILYQGGQHV